MTSALSAAPLASAAAPPEKFPSGRAAAVGRIVIVESGAEATGILERSLGEQGFTLTTCRSLARFGEALSGESADVVVADLSLPEVERGDLLAELRVRQPPTLLICLADSATLRQGLRLLREGAYDCLLKPLAAEELLTAAVRRAFEQQRLERAQVPGAQASRLKSVAEPSEPGATLAEAKAKFEKSYLEQVLKRAQGNAAEAARMAGLDRSNFRRLLKRYGIDRRVFTSDAK